MIDRIPSIPADIPKANGTRELHDQYKALVSSSDSENLIILTMSLYEKKRKAQKTSKKLSSTERAYLKEGESLLFGELSVALGIPTNEVPNYIRNRLQTGKRLASDW